MLEKTPTQWPPDPIPAYDLRERLLEDYRKNPSNLTDAKAYYAKNIGEFVDTWCDTYDPRNAGVPGRSARMPFKLFRRQWELFQFFDGLVTGQCSGLVEKCRDMGATWGAVGFSVGLFLFVPGSAVGWGSRKAMLVDSAGDVDSIFEKLRYLIRSVPPVFYPRGFDADSIPYMKVTCSTTESSITGESGDDIGRGGRKLVYFKDESAHYLQAESIEAALGDNTHCQIDISSVHGLGTVFHKKREAGVDWYPGDPLLRGRTNVFVLDWRDHPGKSIEWYRQREEKAREEGLLHIFRQEVDRDYSASIEGTIIPAEWVKSAIDAHLKIPGMDQGAWMAGLDVADGGGDANAWVRRKGVVITDAEDWGERDVGETARRAAGLARDTRPIVVNYDCIGVGAGVKAEANRLEEIGEMPDGVRFVAWNAGASVLHPDDFVVPPSEDPNRVAQNDKYASPLNKDFYGNLKAQAWWSLRRRFEKVHAHLTKGKKYAPDEMISISSGIKKLRKLEKELSQPVSKQSAGKLRLIVDKTPPGMKSPNLGDAAVECFFPVEEQSTYDASMRWV